MKIYFLFHKHEVSQDIYSSSIIGVFENSEICREVIPEYKQKPGFCDYPDDFIVEEHHVKGSDDFTNLPKVYLVQHEYEHPDGEYDVVTFVGFYADLPLAQKAVDRLLKLSALAAYPDGFFVDCYELGMKHWAEGFDTWPA